MMPPGIGIRAIRREARHDSWSYPTSYVAGVAHNVVIVDWGAVSGTTVTQMARLAVAGGARRVLVCVLFSQLRPDEEAFLTALAGLRITAPQLLLTGIEGPPPRKGATARSASVDVRFLRHFAIGTYRWFDCPVCEQIRRLSDEVLPSEWLTRFAEQQIRRLTIRTRDEVVGSAPVDLFGAPLSSDKAIEMARQRRLLLEALTSTGHRQAMLEALQAMSAGLKENKKSSIAQASALTMFLSMEHQWLKMPPLHFSECRRQVADIALDLASKTTVSDADRLGAIVVLRTASKSAFAEAIPRIANAVGQSDTLWGQLLYDVSTVFGRPYKQSLSLLDDMRTALESVQSGIRNKTLDVAEEVADTVGMLALRAETEWANAHAATKTPVEVWAELRRDLVVEAGRTHHTLMFKMSKVLLTHEREVIDSLVAERERSRLATKPVPHSIRVAIIRLAENWIPCVRFLDGAVLPRLKRLRKIFEGEDCRNTLRGDSATRLMQVLDSPFPVAESSFSKLITAASKDPESLLSQPRWEEFKRDSDFYFETVFRAGGDFADAPLRAFVQSAPSRLGDAFASAWADAERATESIQPNMDKQERERLLGSDVLVFCPFELLREALYQVLENTFNHRRRGERPTLRVTLENAGDVTLTLANDGTDPAETNGREPSGTGLREIRSRLLPFDARLLADPRPEDGWSTYVVKLTMRRGI